MNKKILTLLMAAAMLTSSAAFATDAEPTVADTTVSVTETAEVVSEAANSFRGTVKEVTENNVTVEIETEDSKIDVSFLISEDTVILNDKGETADKISKDSKVIVVTDSELLTRDIKFAKAIVETGDNENVSVLMDTFTKTEEGLINSAEDLILNLEDEKKVDEYDGKTLIVLYEIATLSLPAQTNPTAVVVYEEKEAEITTPTDAPTEAPAEEEVLNNFRGIVKEATEDNVTVEIEAEDGKLDVSFVITENTDLYLMDDEATDIKAGDNVIIFTTSELLTKDIKSAEIIVGMGDDDTTNVILDTFTNTEEGLINSTNDLVLNMDDEQAAELDGKELLVFYEVETKSIPAQTNPTKVVVIEAEEESAEKEVVSISFKVGDSILKINGEDVKVETPYVIGSGVTLVPVRVISEAFGATVDWEDATKKVSITYGDKNIVLTIDSKIAVMNDEEKELEEAAELTDGTTMVPLRAISEFFGAEVGWDGADKSITVNLEK